MTFEVASFTDSKDIIGGKIKNNRSWSWPCSLGLVCHLKASIWYTVPANKI